MALTPALPAQPDAHRPAPVTILAAIRLVTGAGYALLTFWITSDREGALAFIGSSSRFGSAVAPLPTVVLIGIAGGLAVWSLAAGILLLRVRRLGWTLAMLLSGLTLLITITIWWTQGASSSAVMLVEVVSVFYLNQRRVKETFGIVRRRVPDQFEARAH